MPTTVPPTAVPTMVTAPTVVTVPAMVAAPAVVTMPAVVTVPATTAMCGGIGRNGRDADSGCRDNRDRQFTEHRFPPWVGPLQQSHKHERVEMNVM
jgi:hypothetical protein